jgi:aspartate/methionine/tyrosine aminotransferase
VLLERPSYLAAIQVFDSLGAEYDTVPVDDAGMDVETAVRRLRTVPPKLVFALPNFQNPTGVTLTLERRRRLAEAVAASGAALLEDDAYHDLRYEGDALPPLTALAANPWALYTGTFSKTIAPGIRVGYIYAPPPVTERSVWKGISSPRSTLCAASTASAATACWRPWSASRSLGCAGRAPPAGCSYGSRCRMTWTPRHSCRAAWSGAWSSSPAAPSIPRAAARRRSGSTS